jgi:hypothetical protein
MTARFGSKRLLRHPCLRTMVLLDAGATVIDFGTIALFCQTGANPAHTRLLCMGGFEPRRARRSTRVYPTSGHESVVTGWFVR